MDAISEAQFRSEGCLYYEASVRQPPFIQQGQLIVYNPDYNPNKRDRPLKVSGPDDTFHDLSKTRAGYDPQFFNQNVSVYLMTDLPATYGTRIGNVLEYKRGLNFPSFLTLPSTLSYENKVAQSFEQEYPAVLTPATVQVTYQDIMNHYNYTTRVIQATLVDIIIQANGGLVIIPGPGFTTFDDFISQFDDTTTPTRSQVQLNLSYFIKWYLHSSDVDMIIGIASTGAAAGDFQIQNMPPNIRISSDGGTFVLGEIYKCAGSTGIPYLTIPNILDSAGTSDEPFDPTLPIDYEDLRDDIVYPILSNYFSSDRLFLCYVLNPGKTFGTDGLYCFSLCILNFFSAGDGRPIVLTSRSTLGSVVGIIRTSPLNSPGYTAAATEIKQYIDANTNIGEIVRYYFGEVEKGFDSDYTKKCGKNGAGVAYIGKVMGILQGLIAQPPHPYAGPFNSPAAPADIKQLKEAFNDLIRQNLPKGRIPIADARILTLWTYYTQAYAYTGPYLNIPNTQNDFLLLFKLLADYKRTGDYQQIYAVLYKIMTLGSNTGYYTFATGDELAALVSRMLQLVTVLQNAAQGTLYLYRNPTYAGTPAQQALAREAALVRAAAAAQKSALDTLSENLGKIFSFVSKNYVNAVGTRDSLNTLVDALGNPISKLLVLNAIYLLNKLIILSNRLLDPELQKQFTNLFAAVGMFNAANAVNDADNAATGAAAAMEAIRNINASDFLSLINFIQQDLPLLSLSGVITGDGNLSSGTLTIPWLNLFLKNGVPSSLSKKQAALATMTAANAGSQLGKAEQLITKVETGGRLDKSVAEIFVSNFNAFLGALKLSQLFADGTPGADFALAEITDIRNLMPYIVEVVSALRAQFATPTDVLGTMQSIVVTFGQNGLRIVIQTGGSINQEGGTKIIQVGGGDPRSNMRYLYSSINQIVKSLLNKCNNFMVDVFKNRDEFKNRDDEDIDDVGFDEDIDDVGFNEDIVDITSFLTKIIDDYKICDFIEELMFGEDGFLTNLIFLSNEFTIGDLDGSTNPGEVTLNDLLEHIDTFELYSIRCLIFMLVLSSSQDNFTIVDENKIIISDSLFIDIRTMPNELLKLFITQSGLPLNFAANAGLTISILSIINCYCNNPNYSIWSKNYQNELVKSISKIIGQPDTVLITPRGFITGRSFGGLVVPNNLNILLSTTTLLMFPDETFELQPFFTKVESVSLTPGIFLRERDLIKGKKLVRAVEKGLKDPSVTTTSLGPYKNYYPKKNVSALGFGVSTPEVLSRTDSFWTQGSIG